jgi:hypothetical protein
MRNIPIAMVQEVKRNYLGHSEDTNIHQDTPSAFDDMTLFTMTTPDSEMTSTKKENHPKGQLKDSLAALKQSKAQHDIIAACLLFRHGANHVQEHGTRMVLAPHTPEFNQFSCYKQGPLLYGDHNTIFHFQKVKPHDTATLVTMFLATYSNTAITVFDTTLLDTCLSCYIIPPELTLLAQ